MFSPTITQLTTTTTNHANNFNAINNVLLENDKFLRDEIATKSDSTTVTTLSNKIDVLSVNKADKNNAAFTGTMTLNGNAVATNQKTEILFNPYAGYVIRENKSFLIENTVHISLYIEKQDGTDFQANMTHVVLSSPYNTAHMGALTGVPMSALGSITGYLSVKNHYSDIVAYGSPSYKRLYIGGSFLI